MIHICDFSRCRLNIGANAYIQPLLRVTDMDYFLWVLTVVAGVN